MSRQPYPGAVVRLDVGERRSCYRCSEAGHIARDCPLRLTTKGSDLRSCFFCGEQGHLVRDCPKKATHTPRGSAVIPTKHNGIDRRSWIPNRSAAGSDRNCVVGRGRGSGSGSGSGFSNQLAPRGTYQSFDRNCDGSGFSYPREWDKERRRDSVGGGWEYGAVGDPVARRGGGGGGRSGSNLRVPPGVSYRSSDRNCLRIDPEGSTRDSYQSSSNWSSSSSSSGGGGGFFDLPRNSASTYEQVREVEKQVDDGCSVNGKHPDGSSGGLFDLPRISASTYEQVREVEKQVDDGCSINGKHPDGSSGGFFDLPQNSASTYEEVEKQVDAGCSRNGNYAHGSGGTSKTNGDLAVIEISSSSSSEDDDDEEEKCYKDFEACLKRYFSKGRVKEEKRQGSDQPKEFKSMRGAEEEDEECVILDVDPTKPPTIDFEKKLSFSVQNSSKLQDEDVTVISERGQVACRDYPHSRHHCAKYPFNKTAHESCCPQCYCYVCDVVAPCEYWNGSSGHCHASDHDPKWVVMRLNCRNPLTDKVDSHTDSTMRMHPVDSTFHFRSLWDLD